MINLNNVAVHLVQFSVLLGVAASAPADGAPVAPATTMKGGQPNQVAAQSTRYATRDGYSLAFADADVKRVVDAVLGSMLGVDYSIDPAVQGNVTLRTSQPVTREALIPLLETALSSVDAVIVSQGGTYRVVPRKQARARAPLANGGGDAAPVAGFASEIVKLRYGSAKEIGRLVEQFVGEGVVSGTDKSFNQIVISGSADERASARALIERFDVDTLADMSFELFRLQSVDAGTLAGELGQIFQTPFDLLDSRVRLVPLPRLKSILVIAQDKADIRRVEPWIRRLDVGTSGKRKLFSYVVQNGRARDLATSLQLVLGSAATVSEGVANSSPPPPTLGTSGASIGGGTGTSSSTSTMATGNALLNDTAGGTTGLSSASASPVGGGGTASGARIVPIQENNSILIYADGEEYDLIREALVGLDQPSSQVLIEATLAEVTLNNDFRFGVDFTTLSKDVTVNNSTNKTGIPGAIFPGFSVAYMGATAQAVLNTLQSKTNVRVLSAPRLMVLNNQTATLQVGDQVPVITQQSQSVASPGAPIVNNVELRDTGVILKVTPRVNDSGNVTLDIAQEVSDVIPTTTSGINSPTIQQRRLASTVVTRTGQMIALGGLIRDSSSRSKSGLPILSQIPVVGSLFGTYSNNGSRTELIILITPTVIRAPTDVKRTVDELIRGLDQTRPLVLRAREQQVGREQP